MHSPWKYLSPGEARAILGIWVSWSLGVVLLASAAMTLPVANSSPWTAVVHAPPLARWDSVWYRSVAVEGYHFAATERENNVGFYPLYPLVVRSLSRILGTPLLATGICFSIVCVGGALLFMGDLFAEWGGPGTAVWGTAVLLAYPTAFFLAAFYTESMFLLCAAAALWGARRGFWWLAGTASFCGALTRFNGFLLVPVIAAYALPILRKPEGPRSRAILAVAAALLGAAVYPIYLWRRFGDPLLYVRSKIMGWSPRPGPVWALAARVGREVGTKLQAPGTSGTLLLFLEVGSTLLFLGLTVALFRRHMFPEGIFAGGTLLLLLSSGTLDGVQRYVLVLFPCLFPLVAWLRRRPALAFAYGFCGIGVGIVLLHRFVHWIFVG